MNNEPVAWINREEGSGSILDWEKDPYSETNIPLYTHPAKTISTPQLQTFTGENPFPAKTLTDEEILEIWNQHSKYGAVISVYDFAKAILRKAQEK